MAVLFPEGGDDRFVATAFWPMLARRARRRALLLAPARRGPAALLYIAVLVAAFVIPTRSARTPCACRCCSGRRCCCSSRARGAPRPAIAVIVVALLYLAVAARPCGRSPRRTATRRRSEAFFSDARAFLARRSSPASASRSRSRTTTGRPRTWRSVVPLARGWERQLDEKANPLFYDGRPLTADRYHRWLRNNAVRWVALPKAPLDYSAQAEARLLERGVPYLKLAHASRQLAHLARCATPRRRPPAGRA